VSDTILIYNKVKLGYQNNIVINDASFSLSKGDFVFLTGSVGSGKSTLLKSIYAEIPVIDGAAKVLGFNLRLIKRKEIPLLRRKIGYVFQDFRFLNDRNIYQNLKFVLQATGWTSPARIETRIKQVLKEVEMEDYTESFPFELSGGQIQKIAIARALLNQPPLIIADEPTGNLDNVSSRQITKILHNLSLRGTAVIFSTHDLELLKMVKAPVYSIENKKLKLTTTV